MMGLFKENKMFRTYLGYRIFAGLGGGVFTIFVLLSVHLLYENPMYTGIAGFLIALPFIFSFAVGPVVDKRSKPAIMRLTTFIEFTVLALLAFTPLLDHIGVLFMFVVILIFSVVAVFQSPASTALLPQIIPGEKILQANSFIEITSFISALVIAIVMFMLLRASDNINFMFVYGLSVVFLAMAFVVALFIKDPSEKDVKENVQRQNYWQDLKDGAKFIRHNVLLYITIAVVALAFFSEIASVNRPMFFEYYLGAQGYIILAIMALLGGIVASIFVGVVGNKFKAGWLAFTLLLASSVMRVIFVQVLPRHYAGALITLVVYAAFATAVSIIFSSLMQRIPPKDMVGRVDTISTTLIAVFVAVGAIVGGFLGRVIPVVDHIFIYQGISYAVIGVLILLIPGIRKLPKTSNL